MRIASVLFLILVIVSCGYAGMNDRVPIDKFSIKNYYPAALKLAKEWDPQAELHFVKILYSRYLGDQIDIYPFEMEFEFYSNSKDYWEEKDVIVDQDGKIEIKDGNHANQNADPIDMGLVKIDNVELLRKVEEEWGLELRKNKDVGRVLIMLESEWRGSGPYYTVLYRDGFYGEALKKGKYSISTGEPI